MTISLQNISKSYAGEQVLDNVELTVHAKDRIGLIGVNGAGKSTLLRIIAGQEIPDSQPEPRVPQVNLGKARIGFLEQNSTLEGDTPLIDVFKEVQLREGEEYLIDKILRQMGFPPEVYSRSIATFSGGERTRLALAKLLLEEPELLILDEPTNHLDFDTVIWLEDYLKDYRGALLIVSHDRYFLDKLVTSVCEIERGRLMRFKGSYTTFAAQKAQHNETQLKAYEAQQEEIAKLKDYIARNLVRASTSAMAKSRRVQLEKIEANPIPKPIMSSKVAKIALAYDREPYKEILTVREIDLRAGDKLLAESLSFELTRGQRLAIVGANGTGKTTLLRVLMGRLPHSRGMIHRGENVKLAYFDQSNVDVFNENDTALNAVHKLYPLMTEFAVRSLLGSVRLTGDDVYKRVSDLSGGERVKLRMAVMTLERGNVLFLDEPTNHLDIATRDVLETALFEFTGTIVFVSHDRYLLDKLATRFLEITPDGEIREHDSFAQYVASRKIEKSSVKGEKQTKAKEEISPMGGLCPSAGRILTTSKPQNTAYRSKQERAAQAQRRVRVKALEDEIARLEALTAALQGDMENPQIYSNHELLASKCTEFEDAKSQLTAFTDEWLQLSEESEE